jgi:hypothetical protein
MSEMRRCSDSTQHFDTAIYQHFDTAIYLPVVCFPLVVVSCYCDGVESIVSESKLFVLGV